ncbi:MAG: TnpV protein [Oscillospiraceae bacterium]|nr:TnpV protein [Oscillospiraceae bacterium]
MTYREEQGYNIPNLLPAQEPNYHLGKYASLRHSYLRNHRKADFINLLTTGKLNSHLAEIQRTAEKRVAEITKQMKKDLGVTEELKEKDQMKWVGLMNNIKASAEEIVMAELIQS